MRRKIRMGMVGGSLDAFIGAVHRKAANLDGEIELVCGAFSSNEERSKQTGEALYLPDSRVYGNYKEMMEAESRLPNDQKMDFVSIVTPNHLHFEPAHLAIEHNFPVMMDKPLCHSLEEAERLKELVDNKKVLFGLTHTYTGYPMVKHARWMCQEGMLGKLRKVYVEYPQGWLTTQLEKDGQKQASWRTDPKRSGKSGAMGDIGTHAENMVSFVTGLEIEELSAQLNIVVPGRPIDDDGAVFLRFKNGATGVLTATQIATGEENDLKIRVYGEKGGLEWSHADPNTLQVKWLDKPKEIMRAGADKDLCPAAMKNTRLPSGHPEGYIEAFANLYKNFAHQLKSKMTGSQPDKDLLDVPGIEEGLKGMTFIERVVESSNNNGDWVKF